MKRVLNAALLTVTCSFALGVAWAAFDPQEPLLYPGGFPTADVLRPHEWLVAPPPWGWLAYGATEHLTLGWDYPATLLGYPAGFIRYQLPSESTDVHYAIEGYGVLFAKDLTDSRSAGYRIDQHGTQDWIHLERSARLSEDWRWHAYIGLNYATYQRYYPNEKAQFDPVVYRDRGTPDAGVALEWDARPWMKIHLNYTYGNTFVFVDQVGQKHMIVGTLQFAPFSSKRAAFLRNLRFDLSALYVAVPTAHYQYSLPVPIYPTLYWQWGGS